MSSSCILVAVPTLRCATRLQVEASKAQATHHSENGARPKIRVKVPK